MEEKQRQLEERGVAVEKALRGEAGTVQPPLRGGFFSRREPFFLPGVSQVGCTSSEIQLLLYQGFLSPWHRQGMVLTVFGQPRHPGPLPGPFLSLLLPCRIKSQALSPVGGTH